MLNPDNLSVKPLYIRLINASITLCVYVFQILVLHMKDYSELDIWTCLGIRFGGSQDGVEALLSLDNAEQLFDLNQEPISQGILDDQQNQPQPTEISKPNPDITRFNQMYHCLCI
jgi:hypothetical protein